MDPFDAKSRHAAPPCVCGAFCAALAREVEGKARRELGANARRGRASRKEETNRVSRMDRASRLIDAAPGSLYRALVDPDLLVRWLPPDGARAMIEAFEPRPGGRFELTLTFDPASGAEGKSSAGKDVVKGEFVELQPDRRVTQRFTFDSEDPAYAGAMLMRWVLEAHGDATRLTVTAENVPPGIEADVHERAMASSLDKLAALVGRRPREEKLA
jgi:uncharacterized protein YndB with AHSA1/START domain